MKKRIISSIVVFMFVFGFMGISQPQLKATSQKTICATNIIGQGVGTLIKGLIQGKVKSLKSAAKMLFWGSLSGYAFYESKKMIGNGSVTTGIILANIAASVTENTARGYNPFAYMGYTLGPARLEIATPFAGDNKTLLNVQVSPLNVVRLLQALNLAENVSFRNGMISFEAEESFNDLARGWTFGMYPTVVRGVPEHVFYHESVHVVQSLQTMSISPQPFNYLLKRGEEKEKKFKISLLNVNFGLFLKEIKFNNEDPRMDNWLETEAYTLVKE